MTHTFDVRLETLVRDVEAGKSDQPVQCLCHNALVSPTEIREEYERRGKPYDPYKE